MWFTNYNYAGYNVKISVSVSALPIALNMMLHRIESDSSRRPVELNRGDAEEPSSGGYIYDVTAILPSNNHTRKDLRQQNFIWLIYSRELSNAVKSIHVKPQKVFRSPVIIKTA